MHRNTATRVPEKRKQNKTKIQGSEKKKWKNGIKLEQHLKPQSDPQMVISRVKYRTAFCGARLPLIDYYL